MGRVCSREWSEGTAARVRAGLGEIDDGARGSLERVYDGVDRFCIVIWSSQLCGGSGTRDAKIKVGKRVRDRKSVV